MGNCLVRKLKESVDNSNLKVLGFNKIFVDLTGLSQEDSFVQRFESAGNVGYTPVGSYLLNGTFITGKTKVEEGENGALKGGSLYELMVPRYSNPFIPVNNGNPNYNSPNAKVAYNIDDYKLAAYSPVSSGNVINLRPTKNNIKTIGHLNILLPLLSTYNTFYINGSEIIADINTIELPVLVSEFTAFDCPYITGSVRTFISNNLQRFKVDALAFTGTVILDFHNSGVELDGHFTAGNVHLHFSSNELVELYDNNNTVKFAEYNINTDTFVII